MRQLILGGLMALAFVGCKSTSATNTKLDRSSQVDIKGNWSLTSVSYPGSEYIKVNSFGLADSKCFENSSWKFVSNNNKGEMALNGGADCPAFSSPITWFVNKDGQFVLKVLNAGEKEKKSTGWLYPETRQPEREFVPACGQDFRWKQYGGCRLSVPENQLT